MLAPLAGSDGMRVVGKQGVRIDHSFYLAPTVLPGERVFVRMDPEDLGRAWMFSPEGDEFLGEAVCPELAGIDPKEALAKAKAMQKSLTEEKLKELRRDMRKIGSREAADALLRDKARAAGVLVEFPRAHDVHETASLAAARAAIDDAHNSAPVSAIAQFPESVASAPVLRLPETPQQRFRRALELEARMANNQALSNEDAVWLGGYRTGHEYGALKEISEDFAEQA